MSIQSRVTNGVLLAFVIVVSSAAARSGGDATQPFTVRSTLEGKQVLPHRIRWLGHSNLPAGKVAKVEFLIDSKLSWSERNPPYTYGDDSNWLVTSWLSAGRHRFTVRAKSLDGRTAQRTTIARVLATPEPPVELVGSWKRVVPRAQAGEFLGTWEITVDKVGWRVRDPFECCNLVDIAYRSGGRLQARGGIWMQPEAKGGTGGNGWCKDTNGAVDYRWSVSANTLTLALDGLDRCGEGRYAQHFIWVGTWKKVE
jgi:hypothetical protein